MKAPVSAPLIVEDLSDTRYEELPKKPRAREGISFDESLKKWEPLKIVGRWRARQVTAVKRKIISRRATNTELTQEGDPVVNLETLIDRISAGN